VRRLAKAEKAALHPAEGDIARDKEFDATRVPKADGTATALAEPLQPDPIEAISRGEA
jgi:hypothetical protein